MHIHVYKVKSKAEFDIEDKDIDNLKEIVDEKIETGKLQFSTEAVMKETNKGIFIMWFNKEE